MSNRIGTMNDERTRDINRIALGRDIFAYIGVDDRIHLNIYNGCVNDPSVFFDEKRITKRLSYNLVTKRQGEVPTHLKVTDRVYDYEDVGSFHCLIVVGSKGTICFVPVCLELPLEMRELITYPEGQFKDSNGVVLPSSPPPPPFSLPIKQVITPSESDCLVILDNNKKVFVVFSKLLANPFPAEYRPDRFYEGSIQQLRLPPVRRVSCATCGIVSHGVDGVIYVNGITNYPDVKLGRTKYNIGAQKPDALDAVSVYADEPLIIDQDGYLAVDMFGGYIRCEISEFEREYKYRSKEECPSHRPYGKKPKGWTPKIKLANCSSGKDQHHPQRQQEEYRFLSICLSYASLTNKLGTKFILQGSDGKTFYRGFLGPEKIATAHIEKLDFLQGIRSLQREGNGQCQFFSRHSGSYWVFFDRIGPHNTRLPPVAIPLSSNPLLFVDGKIPNDWSE